MPTTFVRCCLIMPLMAMLCLVPPVLARQAPAEAYIDRPYATLAILDKITARVEQMTLLVGEPFVNSGLSLLIERCAEAPMEYTPESVAYIRITEQGIVSDQASDQRQLFAGWMFASSPGLSALEHPVYDVWLMHCAVAP